MSDAAWRLVGAGAVCMHTHDARDAVEPRLECLW